MDPINSKTQSPMRLNHHYRCQSYIWGSLGHLHFGSTCINTSISIISSGLIVNEKISQNSEEDFTSGYSFIIKDQPNEKIYKVRSKRFINTVLPYFFMESDTSLSWIIDVFTSQEALMSFRVQFCLFVCFVCLFF